MGVLAAKFRQLGEIVEGHVKAAELLIPPRYKNGRHIYIADDTVRKGSDGPSWDETVARANFMAARNNHNRLSTVVEFPPAPKPTANTDELREANKLRFESSINLPGGITWLGQGQQGVSLNFERAPVGSNGININEEDKAGYVHWVKLLGMNIGPVPRHCVAINGRLGEFCEFSGNALFGSGRNPGDAGEYAKDEPIKGDGFHFNPGSIGTDPMPTIGLNGYYGLNGYCMFLEAVHQRTAFNTGRMSVDGCYGVLGIKTGFLGGSITVPHLAIEPNFPDGKTRKLIDVIWAPKRQIFIGTVWISHVPNMPQLPCYAIENGLRNPDGMATVHWRHIGGQGAEFNPDLLPGIYKDGEGTEVFGYVDGPHTNGVKHLTPAEMTALRVLLP